MAKKKSTNKLWKRIKQIILFLFLFNLSYILFTKWFFPPLTITMFSSWIQGYGLQKKYISYPQMGMNSKLAVLCSEDQLFTAHNGFDWNAIQKAIKYNANPKHKKTIGASTISQQTAKNVFLWNGRNWFRKGLEIYHTFMIEMIWGKKRILENYLNIAEMGKGIFGIETAAQYYYHKHANELTASQAAWIAAILPNPKLLSIEHPTEKLKARHDWILTQMNNLSDDDEIKALINP